MLVLTRRTGEQIVMPDCEITITVLETHGNKARLGVEAPPAVAVHRAEVWRRICDGHPMPDRSSADTRSAAVD